MSKHQSLCREKFCTNKKAGKNTLCHKHIKRKWREKNIMLSAYGNLKTNAKKRKKEFTITFQDFKEFCIETEYLMGKGRSKTSYTIDRIRDEEGYVKGNLRVLTNSNNVKKENNRRKQLVYVKYGSKSMSFNFVEVKEKDNTDVPF